MILTLFEGDMTVCVENLRGFTAKLELVNEFRKVLSGFCQYIQTHFTLAFTCGPYHTIHGVLEARMLE